METRRRTRRDGAQPSTRSAANPSPPRSSKHRQDRLVHEQRGTQDDLEEQDQSDRYVLNITETTQRPLRPQHAYSPGALSGTTARTSLNSAISGDGDKANEMIDHLMRLNDSADSLLGFLAPARTNERTLANVERSFKDGSGVAGRLLPNARRSFKVVWHVYGGPSPTINTDVVLRQLLDLDRSEDLPRLNWRPDDVFFKANLAKACEDIFEALDGGDCVLQWDKLNREFPEPFLRQLDTQADALIHGTSRLLSQTFRVALGLRIQFAIHMLQTNDTLSPAEFLEELYGSDEEPRGWDVKGMRAMELSDAQKTALISNKQMLLRGAESQTQDGDATSVFVTETLPTLYPIRSFICDYVKWIRARAGEIEKFLETVGKMYGIQEAVERFVQEQRMNDPPFEDYTYFEKSARRQSSRSSGKFRAEQTSSRTTMDSLQKSKQRPSRASAPAAGAFFADKAPSRVQFDVSNTSSPDELPSRPLRVDLSTEPGPSTAESNAPLLTRDARRSIIALHRGQEAEANKENSDPVALLLQHRPRTFIAPQPNRFRVEFDDTQAHKSQESNLTLSSNMNNAQDSSAEPSQDTGFQEDDRPSRTSRKRAAPSDLSSAKRMRAADVGYADSGPHREIQGPPAPDIRAQVRLARAMQLDETQHRAQIRRRWTAREMEYLKKQIEQHGCKWSLIKAKDEDDILDGRDQVALKDKARNMKMEMLKSGHTKLSPKLKFVSLKESEKLILRRMGVSEELIVPPPDAED